MASSSMPVGRGLGWQPELKGNYHPFWEEEDLYIFWLRLGKDVKFRAEADTFVDKVAGSCEYSIALPFVLGLSWLGIRTKALSIDS